MVNYTTFIICLASAFIAGGLVATAWHIFTEGAGVAQFKEKLKAVGKYNVAADSPDDPRQRSTVKPGRPATNTVTGKCPVENCRIRVPHSHTEALLRGI